MDDSHVAGDVKVLIEAITSQGEAIAEGHYSHKISFGALFNATVDTLEALMGTLRAAKKQKIIHFAQPMLLHPGDDKEIVYLFR